MVKTVLPQINGRDALKEVNLMAKNSLTASKASLLARKTAAQHQDNRRAFVTMNGPSKAIKILSLSWRRDDRFSAQNGKD
jgi:hypothetical protein